MLVGRLCVCNPAYTVCMLCMYMKDAKKEILVIYLVDRYFPQFFASGNLFMALFADTKTWIIASTLPEDSILIFNISLALHSLCVSMTHPSFKHAHES